MNNIYYRNNKNNTIPCDGYFGGGINNPSIPNQCFNNLKYYSNNNPVFFNLNSKYYFTQTQINNNNLYLNNDNISNNNFDDNFNFYNYGIYYNNKNERFKNDYICQESTIPTIATKCPISNNNLTDPVRSTLCNHIYNKDSIDKMYFRNPIPRFKCPVPSCSELLFRSEIIDYPEYMGIVNKELKRQSNQF